ncbi:MAG TPA: hypothetical protein VK489_00540 [Ferruginibacter sp.]|nr:hypothetical protein [Ferruginibacter sp.]
MTRSKITILAVSLLVLFSCSKTDPIPDPTPCPIPPTKLQILTQKTWQVDEIHRNVSGVNSKYIKGGVNTTGANYDVWRLTFNANGTGTHVYTNGVSYPTTWNFTGTDQQNMVLTSNGQTLNFNMVEINETYFYATSPVNNILESFRLKQVP